MFKGFQFTSNQTIGFPSINFGTARESYNFGGVSFWLDAALNTNTQTNLGAISSWVDRERSIPYLQSTAGNQPRYNSANALFNNYPTIDFHTQQRFMDTSQPPSVDPKFTFVVVYRKLTDATGTSHSTSLFGTVKAATTGLAFNVELMQASVQEPSVGFSPGTNIFSLSSTVPFGTAAHILVINSTAFIDNGSSVAFTGSNYTGFGATRISGSANNNSGTLEIAEILLYERLLSESQCIQLCNNINNKYAIY
jgi:hypothetical protein